MYEIDHMLNGSGSRQHVQEMIRDIERNRFAREVEAAQKTEKTISLLRVVLVAIIHMIGR